MALSNEDKKDVKGAFGKALANKVANVTKDRFYTSPTGSKHRMGSKKHQYWAAIKRRGEDNARAGVPND